MLKKSKFDNILKLTNLDKIGEIWTKLPKFGQNWIKFSILRYSMDCEKGTRESLSVHPWIAVPARTGFSSIYLCCHFVLSVYWLYLVVVLFVATLWCHFVLSFRAVFFGGAFCGYFLVPFCAIFLDAKRPSCFLYVYLSFSVHPILLWGYF